MKLTKYNHACFTVEIDGDMIVVDPGTLSSDFVVSHNIVAVIVTHSHGDHFDPGALAEIFAKNPDSILLSVADVTEKMPDHLSQTVAPGDTVSIGGFTLEFFGGQHAVIHKTVPVVDNIGVLINTSVYYPGDSLTLPKRPIDTLAIPLAAPWLKISEAIDFMVAVQPRHAFPAHDAVLSKDGQGFHDAWLQRFAEPLGIDYRRIDGQTIDIAS